MDAIPGVKPETRADSTTRQTTTRANAGAAKQGGSVNKAKDAPPARDDGLCLWSGAIIVVLLAAIIVPFAAGHKVGASW